MARSGARRFPPAWGLEGAESRTRPTRPAREPPAGGRQRARRRSTSQKHLGPRWRLLPTLRGRQRAGAVPPAGQWEGAASRTPAQTEGGAGGARELGPARLSPGRPARWPVEVGVLRDGRVGAAAEELLSYSPKNEGPEGTLPACRPGPLPPGRPGRGAGLPGACSPGPGAARRRGATWSKVSSLGIFPPCSLAT